MLEMLATPQSWLSGPPAPDATLTPRRHSRSRPRSAPSTEPTEAPPPKRRRGRPFGFGSGHNSIPNSESTDSPSNNTASSHPHSGDTGCQPCADQERPTLPEFTVPVDHHEQPESCSIDDFRSPSVCEPTLNSEHQLKDMQPAEPDRISESLDSSSVDQLRPTPEVVRSSIHAQPGNLQQANRDTPAATSGWWFYKFPPEIRNMIYEYSLHWPTSKELYEPYNNHIRDYYRNRDNSDDDFPVYSGVLKTPTILLLCRSITAECLPILQSRHFVVDRLGPWLPGASRPMLVSEFVGKKTIQSLRHIELRIPMGQGRFGSGWVWVDIASDILDILLERNSFETLTIVISIFNDRSRSVWELESEYLNRITNKIRALASNNPSIWSPGKIEEQYWIIKDSVAHRHEADMFGNLLACPETREYPDPTFWPGSILEFL